MNEELVEVVVPWWWWYTDPDYEHRTLFLTSEGKDNLHAGNFPMLRIYPASMNNDVMDTEICYFRLDLMEAIRFKFLFGELSTRFP